MSKLVAICEKREAAEHLIFESKFFGDPKKFVRKNGYYESDEFIFVWCAGHLYKQKPVNQINEDYGLKFHFDKNFDYKMPNLAQETVYIPDTEPSKDPKQTFWKIKDNQLKAIIHILKNVDYYEIMLSADADDEGERIHSDPLKYNKHLLKKGVKITRFWNTGSYKIKSAVEKAFNSRQPIQNDKFKWRLASANARSMSDFLVGMKITKLMTDITEIGYLFRCGRVISVILGMIGRREDEIANFVPKTYWNVKGKLNLKNNESIQFNHFYDDVDIDDDGNEIKVHSTQYFHKDDMEEVLNKTKAVQYKGKVIKATKTKTSSFKPKMYSTDDFNSEFMSLYGVDLAYSNAHLEWLRNEGYTSYPRTNGNYFSTDDFDNFKDVINQAKQYFKQNLADLTVNDVKFNFDDLVLTKDNKVFNNSKAATQNHNPLTIEKALSDKDLERFKTNPVHQERKLSLKHLKEAYDLIATRCLVQILPDDVIQKENLTIEIAGYKFETNAEKVLYEGWKKFDKNANQNKNTEIGVNYNEGDDIQLHDVFSVESQTKQPKPYTEQSILKALMRVNEALTEEYNAISDPVEKKERMKHFKQVKKILTTVRGIGTDATRETALQKPVNDKLIEYVGKGKSRTLKLTNLGRFQYELLPNYLKSLETTAIWEQKLDDIRNGRATYEDFIAMVDKSLASIVDNMIGKKDQLNANQIMQKYNIQSNSKGSYGKTNEKQLKLMNFIADILKIDIPEEAKSSSNAASQFIEEHKEQASKQYNEMKNNGLLLKTLSDKQIAYLSNPKLNAPQEILDLVNKKQLNEQEYKIINDFIQQSFNQNRTFSDAQLKVLLDERNKDLLSKKTKELLDSKNNEFTKEEYDIIYKDLQKIFKSFNSSKKK